MIIFLLLFSFLSNIIFLVPQHFVFLDIENDHVPLPRLINSVQSLSIELIDPLNMSTISNGTEILCQISGSHDNKIFYHWSFELTNNSFFVIDEYFIIESPLLANNESLIFLQLYLSDNSTSLNSSWISQRYYFQYDFKLPQYTISHLNNSIINSFSTIEITSSEGLYSSWFSWDFGSHTILNGNTSQFNISVNLPKGDHSLSLHLEDLIGNINHSIFVFEISFAIKITPVNQSFIRSNTQIVLDFSDPYNALFAWDNDAFSGILDPTPSSEGSHVLHVNVEISPNNFDIWNFSFTVDNTPIDISFNPLNGIISSFGNVSITVGESPELIWATVQQITTNTSAEPSQIHINGTDPYWTILPGVYGDFNLTVFAEDIAGNIGSHSSIFNISFGVLSIFPNNNSSPEQGEDISIAFNSADWRTIFFNQGNTYNTTYLESLPFQSGIHNMTIFLEDTNRRWTREFFQWFVKPLINLSDYFNGSSVQTNTILNFTFDETIQQVLYYWGNDPETIITNVDFFVTSMNDWSNKTARIGEFHIKVQGTDEIWNNQSFMFLRDNDAISIDLHETINSSIINAPFIVSFSFNETPSEILYSWNELSNFSLFHHPSPLSVEIPLNVSNNPQVIKIFIRDEAFNWNSKQYQFYTGTGVNEINFNNGSLIRGGSNIFYNLTVIPKRVGYEWRYAQDNSTIIPQSWLPTTNSSILIPLVNNFTNLIFYYDLYDGIILINETKQYIIDSTFPNVDLVGLKEPYFNQTLLQNGTTRLINSEMVSHLVLSENLTKLEVLWNNDDVLFNQTTYISDEFMIHFESLTKFNGTNSIIIYATDIVNNTAYFVWYFVFDDYIPELLVMVPANSALVKPNTSLLFTFNESLSQINYSWTEIGGTSILNNTINVNNKTFSILSPLKDGVFSLQLDVFDISGNQFVQSFQFTVDGSPPIVSFSLENNTSHNSNELLQLLISESINNQSYYFLDSDYKSTINETTITINLTLSEGIHLLYVYVEDVIGNNISYHQVLIIDNTPISELQPTIGSGSWISDDTEFIRFYFNEQPSLVLANWNGDINETLRIDTEPLMSFGFEQSNGRYYVTIPIPANNIFSECSLELFVRDIANNWVKFDYSYFKMPTLQNLFPLVFMIIAVIIIIIITKRESIKTRGLLIKKRFSKEPELRSKNGEELKGDRIIYKKDEGKKKRS